MTSHDVTIAGYVVVVLGAVGLEVAARSHRFDVQTLGTTLSRVMRNRAGRIGMMNDDALRAGPGHYRTRCPCDTTRTRAPGPRYKRVIKIEPPHRPLDGSRRGIAAGVAAGTRRTRPPRRRW